MNVVFFAKALLILFFSLLGYIKALEPSEKKWRYLIHKRAVCGYMAVILVVYAHFIPNSFEFLLGERSVFLFFILLAGFWAGFLPGWEKYHMAFNGQDWRERKQFRIVDWALRRINIENNYLYGVVGMSLRWMVGLLPLYVVLEWYLNSASTLGSWFALILTGPAYWLAGKMNRNKAAKLGQVLVGIVLAFGFIRIFAAV